MEGDTIRKIKASGKTVKEVRVIDLSSKKPKKGQSPLRLKGLILLFATMLLFSFGAAPVQGESAATGVTVDQGTTTLLGGGSAVAFEAERSSVHIVYGEEVENAVYIVQSFPRRLAVLEAYSPDGTFAGRFAYDADTVVVHEFRLLMEYVGTPEQNLVDFTTIEGIQDEHAVKALDLSQSWGMLGHQDLGNGEYRVTLVLYSMKYDQVWEGGQGRVGEIILRITVRAEASDAATVEVPRYRVELEQGAKGLEVASAESLQSGQFRGRLVTWQTKYEVEVRGWDFHGGESVLLVGSRTFFGEAPHADNEDWAGGHLGALLGAEVRVQGIDTDAFQVRTVPTSVHFGDAWDGRRTDFSWGGHDLLVDGEVEDRPRLTLLGAEERELTVENTDFVGVALDGVFAYPQGETIRHDPSIVSRFIEFELTELVDLLPGGTILAQVAVAAVGAVAAYALAFKRSRRRREVEARMEEDLEEDEAVY